jgi:nucleotidyltransferase substrate binding protein (TIGR01987 family)
VEAVKERIEKMNKALDALKENFDVEPENALMKRIVRNSKIQCFEFSFDFFWKTLKVYLSDVQKIMLDSAFPRNIFRACVEAGVISEQEAKQAMEMLDSRNLTSHTYREEIAASIAQKIPEYYQLMYTIINRLKID